MTTGYEPQLYIDSDSTDHAFVYPTTVGNEHSWNINLAWSSYLPKDPLDGEILPVEWFVVSNDGKRITLKRERFIEAIERIRGRMCKALRPEFCECKFGENGCAEMTLALSIIKRIDDVSYYEIFNRDLASIEGLNELMRER